RGHHPLRSPRPIRCRGDRRERLEPAGHRRARRAGLGQARDPPERKRRHPGTPPPPPPPAPPPPSPGPPPNPPPPPSPLPPPRPSPPAPPASASPAPTLSWTPLPGSVTPAPAPEQAARREVDGGVEPRDARAGTAFLADALREAPGLLAEAWSAIEAA